MQGTAVPPPVLGVPLPPVVQPPHAQEAAQIPVIVDPKPLSGLGAPPEYTYHVPATHYAAPMPASNAGLPVQVQVDGRMLSATLVQDVSVVEMYLYM